MKISRNEIQKTWHILTIIICWFTSLLIFFYWMIITFYPIPKTSEDYAKIAEDFIELQTPFHLVPNTPTPFQPGKSYSSIPKSTSSPFLPTSVESTPTQQVLKSEDWEPSYTFIGINFNKQEEISIKIIPANSTINGGKPIKMVFTPGRRCGFGDRKACVYAYKETLPGNTIFVSIHSGIGGQGESFRRAVEGTLINSSAFSLDKINQKLHALSGSQVIISQGEVIVSDLELVVTSRVPPRALNNYFKTPLYETVSYASRIDKNLGTATSSISPQIIFETCGWKNWNEPWIRGLSATSSSVYLGVIKQIEK